MSPKKVKKAGKGSSSSKKRGKGKHKDESSPDKLTELTKETFQLQIEELKGRVSQYKNQCRQLETSATELQEECSHLEEDKQGVVSYLKRLLFQKEHEVTEFQERLSGLASAREADAAINAKVLQTMKTDFQETKDQLTVENMVLGGKLASLEEFKAQKDDILAKFTAMKCKLQEQEDNHREIIHKIERENVLEKEKLKKEVLQMLEDIAANFRNISNKQMAETTRRSLQENAALGVQVTRLRERLEGVLRTNEQLQDTVRLLREKIVFLDEEGKEMTRRNLVLTRKVTTFQKKLSEQQDQLEEQTQFSSTRRSEEEFQGLQSKLAAAENQSKLLRETITIKEAGTCKLNMDLEKALRERDNLQMITAQAARAIQDSLNLVSEEMDSDDESRSKRETLLTNVLEILNYATRTENSTEWPVAKYNLGDLGLIPKKGKIRGKSSLRGTSTSATQTDKSSNLTVRVLPSIFPHSETSSATTAFRILHDSGVSTRAFNSAGTVITHRNASGLH